MLHDLATVQVVSLATAITWVNAQITAADAARAVITTDIVGSVTRTFHTNNAPIDQVFTKWILHVLKNHLASQRFTVTGDGKFNTFHSANDSLRIVILFNDSLTPDSTLPFPA